MWAWALAWACRPPEGPTDRRPVVVPIAAINDFHGAIWERTLDGRDDVAGGFPWLAAAIGALRADHPDLVLLDGGDTFQGDPHANATEGLASVEVMNLLGLDGGAIGNHEFDHGDAPGAPGLRGALERAAAARRGPFLTANVVTADGAPWAPDNVFPWRIVTRRGVKLGVIGLTTTETPQTTLAVNVADLRFLDVVDATKRAIDEATAAGADAIVVTGHLTGKCEPKGLFELPPDGCTPDGEIGALLGALGDQIDVIVAGHAHTLLAGRYGDTFVVEGRSNGMVVNEVDLVFDGGGLDVDASRVAAPWPLVHAPADPACTGVPYPTAPCDVGGRSLAPDLAAIELAGQWEAESGIPLCDRLGCAATRLGRDRARGSPLGEAVADAILAASPGADFAIQNGGGLRADLPAGDVRVRDVYGVMPFDNRVVVVEITGAQALDVFRIGSSGGHGAIQVAGAAYAYDPARTSGRDRDGDGKIADWERDRLCGATIGGKPIDPAATYRIATSDFLVGGGDHLAGPLGGATLVSTGPLVRDAVVDFVRGAPTCLPGGPSRRVVVGPCAGEDPPR